MISGERVECPACGGAGGGPFGRAGSAWDVESYECPRCEGTGRVALTVTTIQAIPTTATGLAKTTADPARRPETAKDARGGPKKVPTATPAAPMTRGAKKAGTPKSRG